MISGDAAKEETVVLNDVAAQLQKKITTQDTIIFKLNQQILNFNDIVNTQDQKFKTSQELANELEVALKKSKRQTKLYKIGSIVGGVAIGILIIQN